MLRHKNVLIEGLEDACEDLRSRLGGAVLTEGQPGFTEACMLWNSMISLQPRVVIQPVGVSDVIQSIAFARENNLEISIKGGGHNVAGFATTDGGLMIDMQHFRNVDINPEQRVARVGGGARWSEFDREAAVFSLASTGGVISTTGVAGLTLGGGVGWLARKHGLASDNLLSAEIVTADGDVITASEDAHPELFWALRGGGGNFGVVTTMEFQLHPLETVFAGMVAYPVEAARDVLHRYRQITSSAPDDLSMYCSIFTEMEHGSRVIGVPFCWSGDPEEGQHQLAPLLDFGTPVMTMSGQMPYALFNGANDFLFPYHRRNYWKGTMCTALDDELLDKLVRTSTDVPMPGLSVTIEWYGGATNRMDPSATAYPHRDAEYQVVLNAQWDDPAEDDRGQKWVRASHSQIAPHGKKGEFLNFVAADGDDRQQRVRSSFGSHWDKLTDVKRRYDPDNVFHMNNNIAP